MKFTNPPKLASSSAVGKFVQTELFYWFKNITSGLVRLDFIDNFSSFKIDNLSIDAGKTVNIKNSLKSIPSSRIIVRQVGNGLVTDGTWDINTLRLINNGAVPVTITVIFFS